MVHRLVRHPRPPPADPVTDGYTITAIGNNVTTNSAMQSVTQNVGANSIRPSHPQGVCNTPLQPPQCQRAIVHPPQQRMNKMKPNRK